MKETVTATTTHGSTGCCKELEFTAAGTTYKFERTTLFYNEKPVYQNTHDKTFLWFLIQSQGPDIWYISQEAGNSHGGYFVGRSEKDCPDEIHSWLKWTQMTYSFGGSWTEVSAISKCINGEEKSEATGWTDWTGWSSFGELLNKSMF